MIYLILFFTFFKIGAFTFGGGYAMLPLIQAEVINHGWMSEEELVNFIAVSESTPGPFAVNISTYIGSETAGFLGALAATLGVALPSFIIILIVAACFDKFRKSRAVEGCMRGLKPAVIALIGSAAVSVGKTVFFSDGFVVGTQFYVSLVIFAAAAVMSFKKIHPIAVIIGCAVMGIVSGVVI